ncbi:hypothetical protein A2U01_0069065, partial [Trifolium medium]|nr:hypothetical protein [Trifolium medium]
VQPPLSLQRGGALLNHRTLVDSDQVRSVAPSVGT